MPYDGLPSDPKVAALSRKDRRAHGHRRSAGRGKARRELGRLMAQGAQAQATLAAMDPDAVVAPARRGRS